MAQTVRDFAPGKSLEVSQFDGLHLLQRKGAHRPADLRAGLIPQGAGFRVISGWQFHRQSGFEGLIVTCACSQTIDRAAAGEIERQARTP